MEEPQMKEQSLGSSMGIFGWKKRCLYVLIILLTLVVTVNLTLVLWIIKVLHINSVGMSNLQVVGSGVQIPDQTSTSVMDTLVMSGMYSRKGQKLSFQSGENIIFRTTDHAGHVASSIHLGGNGLELNTPNFKVKDFRGKTMFSVDKDGVSMSTASLVVTGEGGAKLEGSLQTPIVSADIRSDLVLESTMKGVQAVTPSAVSIESRAGDILVSSYQDIHLVTIDGSIKLESTNVLMPSLKPPQPPKRHNKHHNPNSPQKIYQLCVCGQGDLYLGEADSFCELNELCR